MWKLGLNTNSDIKASAFCRGVELNEDINDKEWTASTVNVGETAPEMKLLTACRHDINKSPNTVIMGHEDCLSN